MLGILMVLQSYFGVNWFIIVCDLVYINSIMVEKLIVQVC